MALAVSVFALIPGIAPEDKETTYETLRGTEWCAEWCAGPRL